MMRAHVIEAGKIVNTIVVDNLDALPGIHLVDADLVGGTIGDYYYENTEMTAPAQPAAPSEAEIVAAYMAVVQRHMDARAAAFGYDNLLSVVSYAEEPAVPRYQAEGQAFRAWRSACWLACEQMLVAVKAGDRAAPTHAQLIDELPPLGVEYSGPFAAGS